VGSSYQTEALPAIYAVQAVCAPLGGAGRLFRLHIQGVLGSCAET